MEYDDGRMILYPLWSGVEVGRRRSKIGIRGSDVSEIWEFWADLRSPICLVESFKAPAWVRLARDQMLESEREPSVGQDSNVAPVPVGGIFRGGKLGVRRKK